MSGTTTSTPSSSASGNISPQSTTMMSSPQRIAMQFMPNSPSPPNGMTWSLPMAITEQPSRTLVRCRRGFVGALVDLLLAASHDAPGDREVDADEREDKAGQTRPMRRQHPCEQCARQTETDHRHIVDQRPPRDVQLDLVQLERAPQAIRMHVHQREHEEHARITQAIND